MVTHGPNYSARSNTSRCGRKLKNGSFSAAFLQMTCRSCLKIYHKESPINPFITEALEKTKIRDFRKELNDMLKSDSVSGSENE